jgi:hypothetical protein
VRERIVNDPQTYLQDMRRYTSAQLGPSITCPSFVADNVTDFVSPGQGQRLYEATPCPKTFSQIHPSRGRRRALRGHGTHRVLYRGVRLARHYGALARLPQDAAASYPRRERCGETMKAASIGCRT